MLMKTSEETEVALDILDSVDEDEEYSEVKGVSKEKLGIVLFVVVVRVCGSDRIGSETGLSTREELARCQRWSCWDGFHCVNPGDLPC